MDELVFKYQQNKTEENLLLVIEATEELRNKFLYRDIDYKYREDWAQEMILEVIKLAQSFKGGDFEHLLAKSFYFRRIDYIKKSSSHVYTSDESAEEVVYILGSDLARYEEAKGKLTNKQRKMFEMLQEGYIRVDIQKELGIKKSAYYRMLNRIIERVRAP